MVLQTTCIQKQNESHYIINKVNLIVMKKPKNDLLRSKHVFFQDHIALLLKLYNLIIIIIIIVCKITYTLYLNCQYTQSCSPDKHNRVP